jgi:hypothetical protein
MFALLFLHNLFLSSIMISGSYLNAVSCMGAGVELEYWKEIASGQLQNQHKYKQQHQ